MSEVYKNMCLLFNKGYEKELYGINTLYQKYCIDKKKEVSEEDKKLIRKISCASSISTKLSYISLRSKIKAINKSLPNKEIQISLPISYSKFLCIKISLPLRISTAFLADIIHVSIKFFSCITKKLTLKKRETKIFKKGVPILLIHGYTGNRTVFSLFRRLLESKETGHVFTINLNKEPGKNDEKSIEDFAKIVAKKIKEIEDEHKIYNIAMEKIHLVGYSMGGLIAAQAALNNHEKIASVTTLSTPWYGSYAAYIKGYSERDLPERVFIPENAYLKKLRKEFLASKIPKTTISGGLDIFVRPNSSMLPLEEKERILFFGDSHHSIVYNPFLPALVRNKILKRG